MGGMPINGYYYHHYYDPIIKVIELHQNCLLLDLVSSLTCEFLRDTQSISFIVSPLP